MNDKLSGTNRSLIETLATLDERLRWLSSWTIHNANHLRESRDGLKVGGHQASCASISAIMTVLYFYALGANDKVAVKPHAGPVLHAIHYLLGNQDREQEILAARGNILWDIRDDEHRRPLHAGAHRDHGSPLPDEEQEH